VHRPDLFFTQLLHKGGERRVEPRLPIGCEVRWSWNSRGPQKAVLLDLSAHSIRLAVMQELPVGAVLEITLPGELVGDEISVRTLVDRCIPAPAGETDTWELALRWDELENSDQQLINELATGRRIGTRITPLQPRPYRDGIGIPDWNELARAGDRRSSQRHRYDGHVDAFSTAPGAGPIGVLGRDLSARGMRIEAADGLQVGADLTVAIHGGNQSDPVLVEARVEREHTDGTLGIAFTLLDSEQRAAIDRVLDALPAVAQLANYERILPTEITQR